MEKCGILCQKRCPVRATNGNDRVKQEGMGARVKAMGGGVFSFYLVKTIL